MKIVTRIGVRGASRDRRWRVQDERKLDGGVILYFGVRLKKDGSQFGQRTYITSSTMLASLDYWKMEEILNTEYGLENYNEELQTVVLCSEHTLQYQSVAVIREEPSDEPCDVCNGSLENGEVI